MCNLTRKPRSHVRILIYQTWPAYLAQKYTVTFMCEHTASGTFFKQNGAHPDQKGTLLLLTLNMTNLGFKFFIPTLKLTMYHIFYKYGIHKYHLHCREN